MKKLLLIALSVFAMSCEKPDVVDGSKVRITIHGQSKGHWLMIKSIDGTGVRHEYNGGLSIQEQIKNNPTANGWWDIQLDGNVLTIDDDTPLEVTYYGDISYENIPE